MIKYNYHIGKSMKDVSEHLENLDGKGRLIAGGTDIMVQIHEKDKRWKDLECLIDIGNLRNDMAYIKESEDYIHIGALCNHTEIEESEIIKKYIPALSYACSLIGSPQIRNRGTLGGSIGNAFPASDPLPVLVAISSEIIIYGKGNFRSVPICNLYKGKGELHLKTYEFIKEFKIRKPTNTSHLSFVKLGRRKALAISRLNCATVLEFDENNIIKAASIAPGCIFTKPQRIKVAEEFIVGNLASHEIFKKAGDMVGDEMIKSSGIRWSTEYKKPVVSEIVYRSLCRAAGLEEYLE